MSFGTDFRYQPQTASRRVSNTPQRREGHPRALEESAQAQGDDREGRGARDIQRTRRDYQQQDQAHGEDRLRVQEHRQPCRLCHTEMLKPTDNAAEEGTISTHRNWRNL